MFAISIPGLDSLSKAFAYALHWLASIAGGNYGVAIILLTILMRIIILPLSIKQTKSMIAMQKLQPQLKEIQKKYKDDREKQGQEMMKLYKENKVSPLGGCLPLILQLPIIFAVFEVLRSLSTKSKFKSILGINPNLIFLGMRIDYTGQKLWSGGSYAQIIVLIILTVITGYVSAKMMTADPKQAKMMALMPVLMGVFAWILPAGVTIYIIVTNLFTMVQQYVQLEREGFYDEKLADLRKLGDGAKWYQRLYLKSMDTGTRALVAIRLRPKPKPVGKKKTGAAKESKKAEASTGSTSKTTVKKTTVKKTGEQARKQETKKEAAASGGGKRAAGKPAAKKTTKAKDYPAKKKS
jgi:YidC/Oxa1 family membrane protein insertase